jgi:hypothetical protein
MGSRELNSVWHFRTIGLGTVNYRAAAKRLASEAWSTGLFETALGYDEKYLKINSPLFWNNHKAILKPRTHGFGFYIWKPFFIKLELSKIPENHGLMYCDSGNLISNHESDLNTLKSYFNLASNINLVGSNSQRFVEKDWSPNDLMDYLGLSDEDRSSKQFLGGFLLITNTPEGRAFITKWANLTCQDNHQFLLANTIDGISRDIKNLSYDQAILSCLLKSESKPAVQIGDKVTQGCVRAARHRYGYSLESNNFIIKSWFIFIALASRIKLAFERRIYKKSIYPQIPIHS